MFFKTYTETVWGVPATSIQADWAAQRIKNLSLASAAINALFPKRHQTEITTLIGQFSYPRLGPGMMWERCAELVEDGGGRVLMDHPVVTLHRESGAVAAVSTRSGGLIERHACTHVISSMPLSELVLAMDPPASAHVQAAARGLQYRDFLSVALVVPDEEGFPDNWIYVHDPEVNVGRIQNYGSWSRYMVKDGWTCLGLEYFVWEDGELWSMSDEELIAMATKELVTLGLADASKVSRGFVLRMAKAYPMYDATYRDHVDTIRTWLSEATPNVYPVGRNGMHRYNNQDHSMYTAMLAVDNILGANHDIWAVNVEADYLEELTTRDAPELDLSVRR
jgi:protoporphyrinogen oxidase